MRFVKNISFAFIILSFLCTTQAFGVRAGVLPYYTNDKGETWYLTRLYNQKYSDFGEIQKYYTKTKRLESSDTASARVFQPHVKLFYRSLLQESMGELFQGSSQKKTRDVNLPDLLQKNLRDVLQKSPIKIHPKTKDIIYFLKVPYKELTKAQKKNFGWWHQDDIRNPKYKSDFNPRFYDTITKGNYLTAVKPQPPKDLYIKANSPSALFPKHPGLRFNVHKDFVYELTNMKESEINKAYDFYINNRQKKEPPTKKAVIEAEQTLKKLRNKIKEHQGTFYEYTVRELETKIRTKEQKQLLAPFKGKPIFKILYGTTIQELLKNPKNARATFQSASDPSALEGRATFPHDLLHNMQQKGQCVQGETAAICFAYGTIYRKYLYILDSKKPFINLLDKIPNIKISSNKFHVASLPIFNKEDYKNFKVGYQHNTTVAYEADPLCGSMRYPYVRRKKTLMKVDHAISFALANPIDRYKSGPKIRKAIRHAGEILTQTFKGTILASYYHGRRKVFLTLVGGGVYNNLIEWIIDAIAAMFPFIMEKNMQVYLVIPSTRKEIEDKDIYQGDNDPNRLVGLWRQSAKPVKRPPRKPTRKPTPSKPHRLGDPLWSLEGQEEGWGKEIERREKLKKKLEKRFVEQPHFKKEKKKSPAHMRIWESNY